LGIVLSSYISKNSLDQCGKDTFHTRAEAFPPGHPLRLYAKDNQRRKRPAQRARQRQGLAQTGVVEGKGIIRPDEPHLIRRETDKLPRLSPNVGSVHHNHALPAIQHPQQVQPAYPRI
jgi:hypothetical protein